VQRTNGAVVGCFERAAPFWFGGRAAAGGHGEVMGWRFLAPSIPGTTSSECVAFSTCLRLFRLQGDDVLCFVDQLDRRGHWAVSSRARAGKNAKTGNEKHQRKPCIVLKECPFIVLCVSPVLYCCPSATKRTRSERARSGLYPLLAHIVHSNSTTNHHNHKRITSL
jgi:hypothetical protein